MSVIYERKKGRDNAVRCFLTFNCDSGCPYCSLFVPFLSLERKKVHIPPDVWAEGINRRNRPVILTGGEPLLYPELTDLVRLVTTRSIDIHTNLQHSVDGFLKDDIRRVNFLVSLHQAGSIEEWLDRARALIKAKHRLRGHVVKYGSDWQERASAARALGIHIVSCDDQSRAKLPQYPRVLCRSGRYHYGPDGFRYVCTTLMGIGSSAGRLEHISQDDGPEYNEIECNLFGNCTACDIYTEKRVTIIEEDRGWE
jgi:hypothetical protein